MVRNHVKSLPKKMDDETMEETLKTLIRYIIGDSLKKEKNFFLVKNNVKSRAKKKKKFGQKQRKILTKKKWMTKEN